MDREKCETCYYWQCLDNWYNKNKCCHYILVEGRMRKKDEKGDCLSYTPDEG